MRTRAIISLLVAATALIAAASSSAAVDNLYFPLKPGTTWVYQGMREDQSTRDVITVTRRTVVIQGVRCTVVHDNLYVTGTLQETTDDYYAADEQGNVRYCGEDTQELDEHGKVVTTEGTWRAGVDGAQSGIIMLAQPSVGQSYREEFYPDHAEDQASIRNMSMPVSVPFGTFANGLQTQNFTRLEPDVIERKIYVPNVGLVHEEDVKGGSDSSDLVSMTLDPGGDD